MKNNILDITLPNKAVIQVNKGTTGNEITELISPHLSSKALAIEINNKIFDLSAPIQENAEVKIITWEDKKGQQVFWHSSAHIMAEALEVFYPNIKFAIGPPIEHGFYYDVDLGDAQIKPDDIEKIEQKIIELAKQKNKFHKKNVTKYEAEKYFVQKNNQYKLEIIKKLEDGNITFYTQGNFTDLCKGPHIPHTGFIQAVKITNLSSAYWQGNKNNKQLTRIYGITFPTTKELRTYLNLIEQAKKRDHRRLGKELKLFTFSDNVGIGLPLWLPNGTIVRQELEKFLRKKQKSMGYSPVVTPHIAQKSLFITSGHYEKYGQDSFQPITTPNSAEEFILKPMNCPHHCEIYKNSPKSYKDLPIRLSEFGTVYRYEQHGELHGIARTRGFTQDDAHIFCTNEQIKQEISNVIDLTVEVLGKLGFNEYNIQISLRDPKNLGKYIGNESDWENAEKAIKEICEEKSIKVTYATNEAAFYGPKLDFMVKDALSRSWQLGTIQLDYQLPQRFRLEYIGSDNQKHTPVIIHRAPFGSLERIIAILLEHTYGKLPLWLTPTQVIILTVSDKFINYAESIYSELTNEKIRCEIDNRLETISKKIREAETNKIPYIIVVGEQEENNHNLSVRKQGKINLGTITTKNFIQTLKKELNDIKNVNV